MVSIPDHVISWANIDLERWKQVMENCQKLACFINIVDQVMEAITWRTTSEQTKYAIREAHLGSDELFLWAVIFGTQHVATLTLGSWPRQGLARVRDKMEAREAHLILPRVHESVREWTLTFASELPLGELESRWTFESSRSDCKG